MKTPFRLLKADEPGVVAGLLLLGGRAADLLALVAALGPGRRPTAYALPDGFLVKLAAPPAAAFPGTIRLRALAADLFLPADAELVPALLPDEAAALVRERGLVFLPGGRVLGYAAAAPLDPAALLDFARRPARTWRALPDRPARPERLREIVLDLPDDTPDAVLRPGGEGVGVEEARPEAAGPLATAAGAAQLGLGRLLMGLGGLLRQKGLARLGAGMAESAVERAPRLSESVLGRQEAALRALLREFREGDLERALRRALPLGEQGGRGGAAAGNAVLPIHKLFYSLNALLGGKPGRTSVWLGGGGAQAELAAEYHKAAEAAAARGDYRRAAFIYGRLLRAYHQAAAVLARGGLHHDAAVLYLEKIRDPMAAARAFAAAGEVDRAVALYRERGEHALAGDLLRQAGEHDAALAEYRAAAEELAASVRYHAAGELMLRRAGRPDLARDYFAAGWARRPWAEAFPCLLSLARLDAEADSAAAALGALADEADVFFADASFAGPGHNPPALFYNELARLAGRPNLAAARDDLRDRALRALAGRLRQSAAAATRPGPEPSALLGQSGEWPAALVSDAAFAYRNAVGPFPSAAAPAIRCVCLARGRVTAACGSPRSGRVCLGFANGLAMTFDPATGASYSCPAGRDESWPVVSAAFDPDGDRILVLRVREGQWGHLSYYLRDGGFGRPSETRCIGTVGGAAYLAAPAAAGAGVATGLWDGGALVLLDGYDFVLVGRLRSPFPPELFRGALILDASAGPPPCIVLDEETAWHYGPARAEPPVAVRFRVGWRPGQPEGSALRFPPLSWLRPSEFLVELVEVDERGAVRCSGLDCGPNPRAVGSLSFAAKERYGAATFVGRDRVAAVRAGGVDWLRRGEGRFVLGATTGAALGDAVACFYSPPTGELLVATEKGDLMRVPAPDMR